ncbi:MAG: hypothetical protein AAF629_21010 [Chloroflexota bacterium]
MPKEDRAYQLSLDFALKQIYQQPDTNFQTDTLFEQMGDLGAQLKDVLDCMKIAEEEIASAQVRQPEKADVIWNSFTYLKPSPLLRPRTPQLYRAHVKELIARVATGKTKKAELEAVTAAELCCIMSAASLAHPLQTDATIAYQKVFQIVFPDVVIDNEPVLQESYSGRAEEIIEDMRRRFKQPRE